MSTLHVRTGRIPNSYKTRNRRKKHLKQVFNFIYFICAMARYTATVPTATTAQRRYIDTISSSAVFTSVPGLVPHWRPTGHHCIACEKSSRRKKDFGTIFRKRRSIPTAYTYLRELLSCGTLGGAAKLRRKWANMPIFKSVSAMSCEVARRAWHV